MSTTETASGFSPSTALATRLVTASTFWAEICAPGRSFTITLALAGCCWSRNTDSLGRVRWTRACSTSARLMTERSSSPSSARL